MINLITVVYDTELSLLRTQASNFDLYVDPKDLSKILILVNDVISTWCCGRPSENDNENKLLYFFLNKEVQIITNIEKKVKPKP